MPFEPEVAIAFAATIGAIWSAAIEARAITAIAGDDGATLPGRGCPEPGSDRGRIGPGFGQPIRRGLTMVVPYPAGGPRTRWDASWRVDAGILGQPVVIENVSGAGGAIGVGRVARAAADGYTLSLGHVQTHVINAATQTLPYDVVKDFEPVSLLADTPQWIVAKSAFPAASLQEMIAWMKANPGKATVGAVGVGGPTDIAAIYFQKADGHQLPARALSRRRPTGAGPGGRTDRPHVRPGRELPGPRSRRTAQGLCGPRRKRVVGRARRPHHGRSGRAGLHSSFWHGLWVPKGTPKEVVAKLHAAVVEALADPALVETLRRHRPGNLAARAADAGGACRHAEGRDRAVVADHQGGEHQVSRSSGCRARLSLRTAMASAPRPAECSATA